MKPIYEFFFFGSQKVDIQCIQWSAEMYNGNLFFLATGLGVLELNMLVRKNSSLAWTGQSGVSGGEEDEGQGQRHPGLPLSPCPWRAVADGAAHSSDPDVKLSVCPPPSDCTTAVETTDCHLDMFRFHWIVCFNTFVCPLSVDAFTTFPLPCKSALSRCITYWR